MLDTSAKPANILYMRKILYALDELDVSPEACAAALDMSASTIYRLARGENGTRRDSRRSLKRICWWIHDEATHQGRTDLDTSLWALCPDVFHKPESGPSCDRPGCPGRNKPEDEVAA